MTDRNRALRAMGIPLGQLSTDDDYTCDMDCASNYGYILRYEDTRSLGGCQDWSYESGAWYYFDDDADFAA